MLAFVSFREKNISVTMLGKICLTLSVDEICRAESYRELKAKKDTKPVFQNLHNLGLKYSKIQLDFDL
jgi:hypothetical protein